MWLDALSGDSMTQPVPVSPLPSTGWQIGVPVAAAGDMTDAPTNAVSASAAATPSAVSALRGALMTVCMAVFLL